MADKEKNWEPDIRKELDAAKNWKDIKDAAEKGLKPTGKGDKIMEGFGVVSDVISNIKNHFGAVKQQRRLSQMASGLWLSASAASSLIDSKEKAEREISNLKMNPYGVKPMSTLIKVHIPADAGHRFRRKPATHSD